MTAAAITMKRKSIFFYVTSIIISILTDVSGFAQDLELSVKLPVVKEGNGWLGTLTPQFNPDNKINGIVWAKVSTSDIVEPTSIFPK